MSFSYLTRFPVETASSVNLTPVLGLLLCVVELLPFTAVFNRVERVHKFLSRLQCSIKLQTKCLARVEKRNQFVELSNEVPCSRETVEEDGKKLCREEAEMVMSRLGIHCDLQDKSSGCCELVNLFQDKEPSLEEVKEAFDVFDENKDGFIDAMELQRVLCALGFKEGLVLDNCTRMINSFNPKLGQKIDFGEFFKLVENTIC